MNHSFFIYYEKLEKIERCNLQNDIKKTDCSYFLLIEKFSLCDHYNL